MYDCRRRHTFGGRGAQTGLAVQGYKRGQDFRDDNYPLSDAKIKEKFVWMSSKRLDPDQARIVMDEVWSLESRRDMAGFMERLHAMC